MSEQLAGCKGRRKEQWCAAQYAGVDNRLATYLFEQPRWDNIPHPPLAAGIEICVVVECLLCCLSIGPLLGQLRAMAPEQCRVGIPGACESIGQGLQDTIEALSNESRTDWVVLQVDVSNAFNSRDLNAVLGGAAQFPPAM